MPHTRSVLGAGSAHRGGARAGTVAARAVERVIDLSVTVGMRREILMDAAAVTEADLRDPDRHLPLAVEIALWQAIGRHTSDPGVGIRSGAALHVRQLGLLGYALCFSATLREGLRRVQRYGRLITAAVDFVLDDHLRQVTLAVWQPALGAGQCVAEDFRLAAVVQMSREITGVDIVPAKVTFTYPQPPNTLAHRQFFRCPLHFEESTAGVVFRDEDLDRPLVKADETLADYLGKHAEHVLASLVRGGTTRHAARAVIWSLLPGGTPALRQVAAALRMPPRTLQRRLASEGTSLHAEIEEIRRTMAVALLRDRSLPIEEVSILLGYADPSTFFRSFKRWTGTTPRRFRSDAA